MAHLKILDRSKDGRTIPIGRDGIVLGRHTECDEVLDVQAVSRQHAQIVFERDAYYVSDLYSRNGTYVNHELIQSRRRLHHDDRITIANRSFVFCDAPRSPRDRGVEETSTSHVVLCDDLPSTYTDVVSEFEVSADGYAARKESTLRRQLSAVVDVNRQLSSCVSLEQLLPVLLSSILRIFSNAARCLAVVQTETKLKTAVRFRDPKQEAEVRLPRHDVERLLNMRQALLYCDVAESPSDAKAAAGRGSGTTMCVPMMNSQNEVIGLLQVSTLGTRHSFGRADLEIVAGIGVQAGMVISNTRLHEKERNLEGVERDLLLARRMQGNLLPASVPKIDGYTFDDYYRPAMMLGGDYFDYVELADGRVAVVMADVAGRGATAALLMAHLAAQARFRLANATDVLSAVNQLDQCLRGHVPDDRFVTMLVAQIDVRQHRVTIVNAGHMPPVLRRIDGRVLSLDSASGLPLGIDTNKQYQTIELDLGPGDAVLLYTDGVVDALNPRREPFTQQRLCRRIATASGTQMLIPSLIEDVIDFTGSQAQTDDMCLVCFGRAAPKTAQRPLANESFLHGQALRAKRANA